jgi:hypothetical protein
MFQVCNFSWFNLFLVSPTSARKMLEWDSTVQAVDAARIHVDPTTDESTEPVTTAASASVTTTVPTPEPKEESKPLEFPSAGTPVVPHAEPGAEGKQGKNTNFGANQFRRKKKASKEDYEQSQQLCITTCDGVTVSRPSGRVSTSAGKTTKKLCTCNWDKQCGRASSVQRMAITKEFI